MPEAIRVANICARGINAICVADICASCINLICVADICYWLACNTCRVADVYVNGWHKIHVGVDVCVSSLDAIRVADICGIV